MWRLLHELHYLWNYITLLMRSENFEKIPEILGIDEEHCASQPKQTDFESCARKLWKKTCETFHWKI